MLFLNLCTHLHTLLASHSSPQGLVSTLSPYPNTHLHALLVSHSSPQVPDATLFPSPRTQDHLLIHHQTASHTTAPNSTPASHPTSRRPLAPAPHPDPHTHTQRLPATTTAGYPVARFPTRATQISSTTNGRLIHLFGETAQLLRLAVPQTLNPAAANGGRMRIHRTRNITAISSRINHAHSLVGLRHRLARRLRRLHRARRLRRTFIRFWVSSRACRLRKSKPRTAS
jgi:hypothetical protein